MNETEILLCCFISPSKSDLVRQEKVQIMSVRTFSGIVLFPHKKQQTGLASSKDPCLSKRGIEITEDYKIKLT